MSKRILIIEDEPDFLRIYTDLLTAKGYQVLTASDGADGLNLATQEKPDLILLDLVLPSLPGLDILDRIRHTPEIQATPIIIFSILGDKADVQKGLDMGANDYAVKGFYSPAEILRKIEANLATPPVHPSITTYRLAVAPNQLDANIFNQQLTCPKCSKPMVLELTPDYTRQNDQWYFTHLLCPTCSV